MAKDIRVKKTKSVPAIVEKPEVLLSDEYSETLTQIKKRISESQVKAVIAANR